MKEVEEDDLHAVTALSGSGPAYVYYLAEALEEAAIAKGFPKTSHAPSSSKRSKAPQR